ncbi:MAG: type II secretion system protein [Chloroflexi bacterium]|nr:type II secretion system protein [Chloroflexota bacterium]MCI0785040.1 type II secretion system protein [Chloroflexota bacterium]MCI0792269.1 type II secretion system protein [Chloroflexota bacterium]MCI0867028.1 type II secretion system protein [Chloroflexota bacterium]MCI0893865.1 type II secretion system protein [Chloroflexota bacterium]
MNRLMRHTRKDQGGFTLVELVVVIAILGVMAAIAVPMVNNFLSSSKEQAYIADTATIQAAVNAYFSSPSNARFLGRRQYPIFGADRTGGTLILADHDHDADHQDIHDHHEQDHSPSTSPPHDHTRISEDLTELGNPLGGTKGGIPKWTDDGNGIRDATEEELLDNDDDSVDSAGWHVATVTREGATYIVDSRDYFIDFEKLVTDDGLLEKVPTSASPDTGGGSESGSYSWYVDTKGRVRSLLFFFPEIDQTGYQAVYP